MELIRGSHNLRACHRGCAVTVGNFDGVHRGHQAVLDKLRHDAARLGLPATVLTFEPHPKEYFAPQHAPARLTRLRDKLRCLADAGIERVLCLPFGATLSSMAAEDFIDTLLLERLGAHYVMVGDDFRFGHARRGDFAMLREAAQRVGFELTRMPTVMHDGERVSSTRVRLALAEGDLAAAEALLGHAYRISGRVARGEALGQQLGWPTANIRFPGVRPPLAGIFAVAVEGVGERRHGVASVGTRPTVNGREPLLETYILDFEGDLYGRHIEVTFLSRLREERRFDSLNALKAQIGRDVEAARAYFAHRQPMAEKTQ